jgi:D-beta-D-heptose 7-phosphate kinase/D-beta-D-heptose 1-phosphate adenosyltransferase
MNYKRAQEIVGKFDGMRVVVVGDVMLDEYIWGQVNRVSPEAPVIVVDAERQSHVPGGAANVVNNLCSLGAVGAIVGTVGDDSAGNALVKSLEAEGADTRGLIATSSRPTTRKTRIIAHSQQVVRVDHEKRAAIEDAVVRQMLRSLASLIEDADAVLLSDYQKGVLTPIVVAACVDAASSRGCVITGNLKPAALAGRAPLDVITMNAHEASISVGGKALLAQEDFDEAGKVLLARTGCKHLLITRGGHGLTLYSASSNASQHVPAQRVEVYDTAGAGDTVVSTLTLALAAGATAIEAVHIANHGAAEVVKKLGVATVSADELLSSFSDQPK